MTKFLRMRICIRFEDRQRQTHLFAERGTEAAVTITVFGINCNMYRHTHSANGSEGAEYWSKTFFYISPSICACGSGEKGRESSVRKRNLYDILMMYRTMTLLTIWHQRNVILCVYLCRWHNRISPMNARERLLNVKINKELTYMR